MNYSLGLTIYIVCGLVFLAVSHILYIRKKDSENMVEAIDQLKDAINMLDNNHLAAFVLVMVFMAWPYIICKAMINRFKKSK